MRLIDADAMEDNVKKTHCEPCCENKRDHNSVVCRICSVDDMLSEIDAQPTAYDTSDIINIEQRSDFKTNKIIITAEWAELENENSRGTLAQSLVDKVIEAITKKGGAE